MKAILFLIANIYLLYGMSQIVFLQADLSQIEALILLLIMVSDVIVNFIAD